MNITRIFIRICVSTKRSCIFSINRLVDTTEGVSLMPLSADETSLDRDALFWHYPHYGNQGGTPASSIRRGDYKLIEFFEDRRVELYNLV